MNKLGKWAVIDIETNGLDPLNDSIIDVGFLEFDGTKLIREYSSLVKFPQTRDRHDNLSHFIQKLTGINKKMLKNAPTWTDVQNEVQELYGHSLIAHNSDFEKSFLGSSFDKIDDGSKREEFIDSMNYLALLHPEKSSLKLEGYILDFELAEKEKHRGFQDSLDLLKVMLISTYMCRLDSNKYSQLSLMFEKYELTNYWFYNFFNLSIDELIEIADQLNFDLVEKVSSLSKSNKSNLEIKKIGFSNEFSGENIENIFKSESLIQKEVPNYRFRKPQLDLALRAGQSFKHNVHSLIQAPTGTGKTLGYLIPSTLFAKKERKQVLISTGTKTLQNQALEKDIPQLRKILGLDESELKVSLLVGSNNHLCELIFRQDENEKDLFEEDTFDSKFSRLYFDSIFYHNSVNLKNPITRDDLPFVFKRKSKTFNDLDKKVAVDFRACTGSQCPFKNECSYIQGLRGAKDSHLIIGNHALMFNWPKGMPRPLQVVVDEAHRLEGESTRAFTSEVEKSSVEKFVQSLSHLQGVGSLFYLLAQNEESIGSSTEIINQIRSESLSSAQMLKDNLEGFDENIEQYMKRSPRYTDIYWNELPFSLKKFKNEALGLSIVKRLQSLQTIFLNLYNQFLPYIGRWEAKNLDDENQIIALTRFDKFIGQLEDFVTSFELILKEANEYTHSIKFHERDGYVFSSAPINVGEIIYKGLLETSESVVMTSATLGNAHGDQGSKGIEWTTGYAYLDPKRRFKSGLYLPSSYDYKNKTKVYLCDDLPPMYKNDFVSKAMKKLIPLIRDIDGRSLLLFSSRKRFEEANEILLDKLEAEFPIFVQGMGNNVVEDFKKSSKGILIGMESFGEGIDIPGEKLQFVFIDKIPDLRMDLVIQERRDFYDRNLGNEFTDYYLASRTRSLHQKLGRLIRTESDFGGIIVADSRIKNWKGKTMEKVNKLMEPYQLNRQGIDEACKGVREFIEQNS